MQRIRSSSKTLSIIPNRAFQPTIIRIRTSSDIWVPWLLCNSMSRPLAKWWMWNAVPGPKISSIAAVYVIAWAPLLSSSWWINNSNNNSINNLWSLQPALSLMRPILMASVTKTNPRPKTNIKTKVYLERRRLQLSNVLYIFIYFWRKYRQASITKSARNEKYL